MWSKLNDILFSPVKVVQLGNSNTFAIFFIGERLNLGVELGLITDDLIDFQEEIYKNNTNDILQVNSDVAYTNVDELNVRMGSDQDVVSNIRGTSALKTYIYTQEGDDEFFVSSDADERLATIPFVDVLYGTLDYMEGDLYMSSGSGRHRLLMSDVFSMISKGVGRQGPAELTNTSLSNLADNLGNIYFNSEGNWYGGINIWLGTGEDVLNVTSVQNVEPNRTITSVFAGNGSDVLGISLDDSEHSLFVGNGQGGDDTLDASESSLPVILFGDGGSDTILGGTSEDVLIGDYGRVFWIDEAENEVGRVGGGGYDDYNDGVIRQINRIEAVYPPPAINYDDHPELMSSNDTISGNGARDVIVGCADDDVIRGNDGSDVILASFGEILFDDSDNGELYGLRSIHSLNCSNSTDERNHVYGNDGDGKYMLL